MVPPRRGGVWLTSPLIGGALRGRIVAAAEQNQLPVASFQSDSHSKGIFVVSGINPHPHPAIRRCYQKIIDCAQIVIKSASETNPPLA